MDLVFVLYVDRNRSKTLLSNTTTYAHGLKVMVTGLEI